MSNKKLKPKTIEFIKNIAEQMRVGNTPWQQYSAKPVIPYRLDNHQTYDAYHSMAMLIEGKQRGFKSPCWLEFNQIKEGNFHVLKSSKALQIEEASYLVNKSEVDGKEYSEIVFARNPKAKLINYFNIEQCEKNFLNRIFRSDSSSERSSTDLQKNRAAFLKSIGARNFNNGISMDIMYEIQNIHETITDAYVNDSRYNGLSEHELDLLSNMHVNMVQYILHAEMGVEYTPYIETTVSNGETFIYGANDHFTLKPSVTTEIADLISNHPELFIYVCHDVDVAVDKFFGRENVYENQLTANNDIFRVQESQSEYGYSSDSISFIEDDDLVYPENDNTLLREEKERALSSDKQDWVFIDYHKPENLWDTLPDAYFGVREADEGFKEKDEELAKFGRESVVRFTLLYTLDGKKISYSGRYDLGANEGGLLQHISRYVEDHLHSPQYREYLKDTVGIAGLKEKLSELSYLSKDIIPNLAAAIYPERLQNEMQPDELTADYAIGDDLDRFSDIDSPESDSETADIKNLKEVNVMADGQAAQTAHNADNVSSLYSEAENVQDLHSRDPDSFIFPDGTVVVRDLEKFPANNGYNKLIMNADGTPRMATATEIELMKSWEPDSVKSEIVYRKDYMEVFDRAHNIFRDDRGKAIDKLNEAIKKSMESFKQSAKVKNVTEYIKKAREDAISSEGDRIADEKQNQINKLKDALKYSRRERKENNDMAYEQKLATEKQKELLLKNYDNLSPYYKAHLSKNDLVTDSCKGLTSMVASDAINGAFARKTLMNYLPADDSRWETMSTKEAKDLAESFKGKINLHQKAYYTKHDLQFDENTTYEEAKNTIDNGKPTEKQLKYAATFIPAESLENLTNKDLNEAIKAHRQVVAKEGEKEVTNTIFRHAQECGLVKDGETYTNAQWAEDSKTCKPMPALEAYVEFHQLHNDVKYFMDKYPEHYPEKSQALYSMVQQRHEKKMVEKQNAPMDPYQEKFLKNHQISIEGVTKWQEAQYLICDRLYKERLVGYQDACMLATNPEIKVPDSYIKAVSNREVLSDKERESIAKAVNAECNKVRVAERTYRIEIASIPRQNSMTDMARLACKEHLAANNGSYKGAEKAMADILVTSNFTISDYEKENFLKSHKELKDISEVTDGKIIAHKITCVLPDCVGKYKERYPEILNVVTNSEKARDISLQKEEIKAKAKQKANTQSQNKSAEM